MSHTPAVAPRAVSATAVRSTNVAPELFVAWAAVVAVALATQYQSSRVAWRCGVTGSAVKANW